MKRYLKFLAFLAPTLLMILLVACNLPSRATPTQPQTGLLLYTAAAQTVQAQLTQAAQGTQIVQPTQPVILQPSATQPQLPTPTFTQAPPTATQVPPTSTQVPIPCDRASFVEDVTYPDNTEVTAGSTFIKTWRLKNNGTCTWNSGYSVVFVNGDSMGGPPSLQLTTGVVAPGQTIDISVTLVAPNEAKTYQGNWQLRNGSGVLFGIGNDAKAPFWVKVKVVNPVPTSTATPQVTLAFDFIARGPDAGWYNATTQLAWTDPPEDSVGVAINLDSAKLENGKTYNKILATYPQRIENGVIYGIYPSYTIQNGDHFRTFLGFRNDCGVGKVRYQLKYREGNTDTLIAEWVKVCDKNVLSIDTNLSGLAGKSVQFILYVSSEGSFQDDICYWVNPRIER